MKIKWHRRVKLITDYPICTTNAKSSAWFLTDEWQYVTCKKCLKYAPKKK